MTDPVKSRRRGPTRDRLKAAARTLFAERGVEGTTVRDILSKAGEKNGASLNYYFGSKEGLVREIILDVFKFMEGRWQRSLEELEKGADGPIELREYVRLLVNASDSSDVEEVPTIARLTEALTHYQYVWVNEIIKENKLVAYDKILSRIAERLDDLPSSILRQRLLLMTRYLSSVFAIYEAARASGHGTGAIRLPASTDIGQLTDTAVGLLTAEIVDAKPSS